MAETHHDALLVDVITRTAAALGGSPWKDDAEAAFQRLSAIISATINADLTLAEIFNRPLTAERPDNPLVAEGIPF